MEKFVLVTRGRTGSTAVLDELGKTMDLLTTQELFLRGTFPEKLLKDYYKLLPPFDLWRQHDWWWERIILARYRDARQAHRYLIHAETLAQQQGAKAFGWKVLSHQFDERPFLSILLKQHDYRAVYLRRNIARQVLSGMVAKQCGIYNSREKIVDKRSYHINLDEFQWHIEWERESVKKDIAWLGVEEFDFVEISYEDYCANREAFYGKIFNLLNLPLESPPQSDFVKMIEDPKIAIENYDEVAEVAIELGEVL